MNYRQTTSANIATICAILESTIGPIMRAVSISIVVDAEPDDPAGASCQTLTQLAVGIDHRDSAAMIYAVIQRLMEDTNAGSHECNHCDTDRIMWEDIMMRIVKDYPMLVNAQNIS